MLDGKDITHLSPGGRIRLGVAYVPEDRLGRGVDPELSIAENLILKCHSVPPFSRWFFLDMDYIKAYSQDIVSKFDITVPNVETAAGVLSGGNLQKLILAREITGSPKLLVACEPTSGLDVGATEYVRKKLLEGRELGMAILLISSDLDEVMMISDRIAVLFEGRIMGILPAEQADMNEIALMMAGSSVTEP
jgi:simple sugar transport system ATP-binding protein